MKIEEVISVNPGWMKRIEILKCGRDMMRYGFRETDMPGGSSKYRSLFINASKRLHKDVPLHVMPENRREVLKW